MGQGINNKNINKDEKTNIQFFNEVRVIETNSKEKRYNPGREYKRQVEQKKMGGGEGGTTVVNSCKYSKMDVCCF